MPLGSLFPPDGELPVDRHVLRRLGGPVNRAVQELADGHQVRFLLPDLDGRLRRRKGLPGDPDELPSFGVPGHEVGQRAFLGTIKGKNQLYQAYEAAKDDPEWFTLWQDVKVSLATEEGATITAIRRAMQDDLDLITKGLMTQEEYDQEWFLSPHAAIKGAYYSKQLALAYQEGRIRRVPWAPGAAGVRQSTRRRSPQGREERQDPREGGGPGTRPAAHHAGDSPDRRGGTETGPRVARVTAASSTASGRSRSPSQCIAKDDGGKRRSARRAICC